MASIRVGLRLSRPSLPLLPHSHSHPHAQARRLVRQATSRRATSYPSRTCRYSSTTSSATASAAQQAARAPVQPPRRGIVRRAAPLVLTALVASLVGAGAMAASPTVQGVVQYLASAPSDSATARMFVPARDSAAAAADAYISAHPLVASLRADKTLVESRPHLKFPPAWRDRSLTAGTLMGEGRVTVPPVTWCDEEGKTLVSVTHLGDELCGHPGIVHGGFLATMLDESLARCCIPALPGRTGMTAFLNVNYRKPAPANAFYVIRANTTKVEGRKAFVKGRIETLPQDGEEPVLIAEAEALFVAPKNAALVAGLMKASG